MPWKPLALPSDDEVRAFTSEFKKKAKFLVDESLGPTVAEVLREAGWNARYTREVALDGHDDADVLAFAQRENRILLTHDAGFLEDRKLRMAQ